MPDRPLLRLLDVVTSGGPAEDADLDQLADRVTLAIPDQRIRTALAGDIAKALADLRRARIAGDTSRAIARMFDLAFHVESEIEKAGQASSGPQKPQ